eukprot:3763142-Prymnesium_polylepis.1
MSTKDGGTHSRSGGPKPTTTARDGVARARSRAGSPRRAGPRAARPGCSTAARSRGCPSPWHLWLPGQPWRGSRPRPGEHALQRSRLLCAEPRVAPLRLQNGCRLRRCALGLTVAAVQQLLMLCGSEEGRHSLALAHAEAVVDEVEHFARLALHEHAHPKLVQQVVRALRNRGLRDPVAGVHELPQGEPGVPAESALVRGDAAEGTTRGVAVLARIGVLEQCGRPQGATSAGADWDCPPVRRPKAGPGD